MSTDLYDDLNEGDQKAIRYRIEQIERDEPVSLYLTKESTIEDIQKDLNDVSLDVDANDFIYPRTISIEYYDVQGIIIEKPSEHDDFDFERDFSIMQIEGEFKNEAFKDLMTSAHAVCQVWEVSLSELGNFSPSSN
jgi:hypothetical protein